MAILVKKRLVPRVTPESELEDIGLLDTVVVPPKKAVKMGVADEVKPKQETLYIGSRVIVNHGLFPWIKKYSQGDVGTVIRIMPNADKSFHDYARYDIINVELDSPADARNIVGLSRWELDVYKEVVEAV